ncbi:DUF3263 domain-containing protein [Paramicrobacterium agarici]|uniref:Uncharacterized protein DUF3263 n=1 Tax=Paramicrobacterium agarici TaxID=630514 RepID=A0A2A9DXD5_9MICO|nr:DUF3263 domain-containing protein [Microbacterium agarici]PFG30795.1 uncharacterized protein DUF3263 [Microbacterium agarici]TQO23862.1 uncharacterized protein DUF3263 [Microbacterium agarici]
MAPDGHTEHAASSAGGELSVRDKAILDFERQWWKHAGTKEQAIRQRFDVSSARYYQLLAALIRRPEALVYDPMLVKRLLRVRDQRSAARRRRTSSDQ